MIASSGWSSQSVRGISTTSSACSPRACPRWRSRPRARRAPAPRRCSTAPCRAPASRWRRRPPASARRAARSARASSRRPRTRRSGCTRSPSASARPRGRSARPDVAAEVEEEAARPSSARRSRLTGSSTASITSLIRCGICAQLGDQPVGDLRPERPVQLGQLEREQVHRRPPARRTSWSRPRRSRARRA